MPSKRRFAITAAAMRITPCSGHCWPPRAGWRATGQTRWKTSTRPSADFAQFKEKFNAAATTRFGSGWAWLLKSGGKLEVTSTANQDSPIMEGKSGDSGPRRLGTRLLSELSESPPGIHCRFLECRELERSRKACIRVPDRYCLLGSLNPLQATTKKGQTIIGLPLFHCKSAPQPIS